MPDTDSVVIVKAFDYRGQYEEFSNRYHLTWQTDHGYPSWKFLCDAIITLEQPLMPNTVSFVRAYCYIAGTEHSIVQIDYTVPPNVVVNGTYPGFAADATAGDTAATIRWDTGEVNSRGKRIYCRKYFHAVYRDPANADKLAATQHTAMTTFANKMIDGSLPGTGKYCGPQGAELSAPLVSDWLTTRTLKRRGKRPLP